MLRSKANYFRFVRPRALSRGATFAARSVDRAVRAIRTVRWRRYVARSGLNLHPQRWRN